MLFLLGASCRSGRPLASAPAGGGRLAFRSRGRLGCAALAEAPGLGEVRAALGVVGGDHRGAWGQAPLGPVCLRGETPRGKMALERLIGTAVLQADQAVGLDRLADRDGGPGWLFRRLFGFFAARLPQGG